MKKQLVLALALATAPFAASAQQALNYNFVELGAVRTDIDVSVDGLGSASADFDGAQLRGSVQVADPVYLFGGYAKTRNDDAGFDVDINELQLGVGFRAPVGESADFIAEVGLLRQEIELEGESEHAAGGRISAGFRGRSGELLEGWIKASYSDGGDLDGAFSALLGAQISFNRTWGVIGEIESGEIGGDGVEVDATKYLLGLRASF